MGSRLADGDDVDAGRDEKARTVVRGDVDFNISDRRKSRFRLTIA
jgi:ribosomal protein L27